MSLWLHRSIVEFRIQCYILKSMEVYGNQISHELKYWTVEHE